ncbi:hypothetical protein D3C86_1343010 [compost metagenome]
MLFVIPVPDQVPPAGVAHEFRFTAFAFLQAALTGFVKTMSGLGLTVIGINCVPTFTPFSKSVNCKSTIVGLVTSFVLLTNTE